MPAAAGPVGSGDTALRCGRLCSTGAKVHEASVNYLQVTRIRHSHRHGLRNCVRHGNTAGKVIRPLARPPAGVLRFPRMLSTGTEN